MNKQKIKEWLKRYLPGELASTALAWAGAKVVYEATKDPAYAALAATWAGNIGYYAPIFAQSLYTKFKTAKRENRKFSSKDVAKTARDLVIEFGPSGTLDAIVTRPLLTGIAIKEFGDDAGVFLGRYSADAIFYGITIPLYEMAKKFKQN